MLYAVDWMVLARLDCFMPGYRENMFPLEAKPKARGCLQGEGFAWAPVGRAQHSSERLRTSSCQCGKGLASSPWAQPEAVPRRAKPSQSMALALSHSFGAGKQRGVRAPSSLEDSGMLGSCGILGPFP